MSELALEAFAAKRAEREGKTNRVGPFEGGEFLVVKIGISPIPVLKLAEVRQAVTDWTAARDESVKRGTEPPEFPYTDAEIFAASDSAIRACLAPDSYATWDKMSDPSNRLPYTQSDMYWMADMLIGATTEFPTERPVGSSTGQQADTATSKGKSASRAARSR